MDKILFIGKKTKSVYNTLSGLGYEVRYLELVSSAEDIVKFIVANADNAFAIIYDLSEFTFCVSKDNFAEIISAVSKMAASTIQVVKGIPANYKEYFIVAETLGIYNFLKSITTDDLIKEITKIFPNKSVSVQPDTATVACQNTPSVPQTQNNNSCQSQPKKQPQGIPHPSQTQNFQIPKKSPQNYTENNNPVNYEKKLSENNIVTPQPVQQVPVQFQPQNQTLVQPSAPKIIENQLSDNIQPTVQPTQYMPAPSKVSVPQQPQVRELTKKELKEIKKQEKVKAKQKAKEEKQKAKFEAKRQAVAADIQPMQQAQAPIGKPPFQPQQSSYNPQTVMEQTPNNNSVNQNIPPVIKQPQMQSDNITPKSDISTQSGIPIVQSPMQSNALQPSTRPTKITTIGVIGIMPRVGTTTQAIMLTRFLNEAGIKACYVEENNSQFCDCLTSLYDEFIYDSDRDCLIKDSLTLYKEESRSFIANDVAYRIVDYGYLTDNGFPENYLKKDIKIIVCGTAPLEIAHLVSNVKLMYDIDLNYIFSLSDNQHYQEILNIMGTKKDCCYLSPNVSDSFDTPAKVCGYIYNCILNLNIPINEINPDNQKKKRWRK